MSAYGSSKPTPSNLISFPSVSSSLHSLPQATSLKNVDLHPNMYANRAAESEAKVSRPTTRTLNSAHAIFFQLQKALARTHSSQSPAGQPLYRVTVSQVQFSHSCNTNHLAVAAIPVIRSLHSVDDALSTWLTQLLSHTRLTSTALPPIEV